MSRCFPYPPPRNLVSRCSSETLIEPIELRKERKKTKEQRTERKRSEKQEENIERREEKKVETSQKLDKSSVVKSRNDKKVWADEKDEFLLKGREAEIEQMEKSSLSEEHRPPVCLDVPSPSSSYNTGNSQKRKRHSSLLNGKTIRVQLPLKKNEPEAPANELWPSSKSGDTLICAKAKDDGLIDGRENSQCTLEGGGNIHHHFSLKTKEEQICSTSWQILSVPPGKTGISSVSNSVMISSHRAARGYKNLIQNWSPPQLHNACLAPDLDWLFQSRNPNIQAEKRLRSEKSSMSYASSAALWAPAQYLNDVELYAFPFTVLF